MVASVVDAASAIESAFTVFLIVGLVGVTGLEAKRATAHETGMKRKLQDETESVPVSLDDLCPAFAE
jgi:hypothetical protein